MKKPVGLDKPVVGQRGAKIGVYGQFGTGKTELCMSAVEVAHLLLVDAEGRSQYYDPEKGHGFEVIYSKDVNEAVKLLEYAQSLQKQGEKVVFAIDGFSSMWFEQQEVAERAGTTSRGTAKYSSWAVAKKPLKQLYSMLYATPVDTIITMRSKPRYDVDASGNPKATDYQMPDTERGINYAVDLVVEMHKKEAKPGTPLKPADFSAVVIKTSGPKENNPIPIGTRITDPSFAKLLMLRLDGKGDFQIAGADIDIQAAKGVIQNSKDLELWANSLGINKEDLWAMLGEKHESYQAKDLTTYIDEVWAAYQEAHE